MVLYDEASVMNGEGHVLVSINWAGPSSAKATTRKMLVNAANLLLKRMEQEGVYEAGAPEQHGDTQSNPVDLVSALAEVVYEQGTSHKEKPGVEIEVASEGIFVDSGVPAWAPLWRSGSCNISPDYSMSPAIRASVDNPEQGLAVSSDIVDAVLVFLREVAVCSGSCVPILRWSVANVNNRRQRTRMTPERLRALQKPSLLAGVAFSPSLDDTILSIVYMELDSSEFQSDQEDDDAIGRREVRTNDKHGHWVAIEVCPSSRAVAVYDSRLKGHRGDTEKSGKAYAKCLFVESDNGPGFRLTGRTSNRQTEREARTMFKRSYPYSIGILRVINCIREHYFGREPSNGAPDTEFNSPRLYGGNTWTMRVFRHKEAQSTNNCASASLAYIDQRIKSVATRKSIVVEREWLTHEPPHWSDHMDVLRPFGPTVANGGDICMDTHVSTCGGGEDVYMNSQSSSEDGTVEEEDNDCPTVCMDDEESAGDDDDDDDDDDTGDRVFRTTHSTTPFEAAVCDVTADLGDKTRRGLARITEYPGYWLSRFCPYAAPQAAVREALIAACDVHATNRELHRRGHTKRQHTARGTDNGGDRSDKSAGGLTFEDMVYSPLPPASVILHETTGGLVSKCVIINLHGRVDGVGANNNDHSIEKHSLECTRALAGHVHYCSTVAAKYASSGLFGKYAKRMCDQSVPSHSNLDDGPIVVYEKVLHALIPTHDSDMESLTDKLVKRCQPSVHSGGDAIGGDDDHTVLVLVLQDQADLENARSFIRSLDSPSTRSRLSKTSSVTLIVASRVHVSSELLVSRETEISMGCTLSDILTATHDGTPVHTNPTAVSGPPMASHLWVAYASHSGQAAERAKSMEMSSQAILETPRVPSINKQLKRLPRPDPSLVFGKVSSAGDYRQVYCLPF